MGVYIWNRLPSTYQEVEYIKSPTTGTYPSTGPYINTGYIPTINTKIELQYMYDNSASGNFPIYGTWQNKSGNTRFNGWYINTDGITFGAGNQNGANGYISAPANTLATVQHYISNSTSYNVVNGTTKTTSSVSFTGAGNSIYIFARNNSSSTIECGGGRIYYFRIYDNGTLVRNFIPCYRKSDSVIGLYDLVNNQFYTNSGTGTFSKGSDVTMVEMKNAYIGEVWTPGSNTLAYFPMQGDNLDKVGTFTLDVSGTQQTIGRKFTSQTSLNTTPTGIKTMSGWVKIASATPSGGSSGQCGILASYGNYLCYFNSSSDVKAKSIYCYANNTNYYKNVNIIDNSWHHIAITNNGSTIVGYVDGVSYALGNPSLPGLSKLLVFCSGGNTIDVTLSEVILENKQWTQSEVSHYFDITKANYGIS